MSGAAWTYLTSYLRPLETVLSRTDVTDIYVNRPCEIWVETLGGEIERHEAPELSASVLERLARQVAALSNQGVSRESPLLSASLPDGSRIQFVLPPATRGHAALAIRKHVMASVPLEAYVHGDGTTKPNGSPSDASASLSEISPDVLRALRDAVRSRRNIIVSGGTSTGKTTFLNALLREVPKFERLIFIEDTPELRYEQPNAVGLLAVRGAMGEARVSADDLVSASLRMRPDRIILGELRGSEAYAFLRAINTGHPGSMTTIHADSVDGAVEQLVLLILQAGTQLTRQDVREYILATVGLFVQLGREGGRRGILDVRAAASNAMAALAPAA